MIRIVFPETTSLPIGGYQYSTFDIITHLAEYDVPTTLYYVGHDETAVFRTAQARQIPAQMVSISPEGFSGWRRPWWILQYMWRAWRFLRREHIDFVHSSNETLLFWLIPCLLAGAIPIWNVRAEMPDSFRGRLRQKLHLLFCRDLVYVSRAAERSVQHLGLPGTIHSEIIRNLLPRRFTENVPPVVEAPDVRVSFVGRIDDPNKRSDLAVDIALQVLERSNRPVSFHFWGRVNDATRKEFQQRIPEQFRTRVVLHGMTANCDEIYSTTDILLLTSLSEGSPRVIMEAGAFAIPTVATPAGGVPELIVDGVTGMLFEAAEHGAGAIVSLIDDPSGRRRMGLAAQHHFREHFGYQSIIPQYISFYESCLRLRRPKDSQCSSTRSEPLSATIH